MFTARENAVTSTSLIYAGFFIALYFVAHLGLRAGLPDADPYLLPLAALLTAIGQVEIYRLDPLLARDQSVWIVIGVAGFWADPAGPRPPARWRATSTRWAPRPWCCCSAPWWSARP